jgi:hypothetical protein
LYCRRDVKDRYLNDRYLKDRYLKDRCFQPRYSVSSFANISANSAEDHCSAVVANQAVAVLAVSSTAVHSGFAAGRIAALQPLVLHYSPAADAEIPEA